MAGKVLPVFVCSGQGVWNVQTSCTIFSAASLMGRTPYAINSEGTGGGGGRGRGGVALARTTLLQGARKWVNVPEVKAIRGLWVDDDLELRGVATTGDNQAKKLAQSIEEADRHGWNFVVAYRLLKPSGEEKWAPTHWKLNEPYTTNELASMKDFDVIDGFSGLGFYYGETPLDYHFRMGGANDEGEDYAFFKDNKIELRVVFMEISHFKGRWVTSRLR